jgi:hypothetical protein
MQFGRHHWAARRPRAHPWGGRVRRRGAGSSATLLHRSQEMIFLSGSCVYCCFGGDEGLKEEKGGCCLRFWTGAAGKKQAAAAGTVLALRRRRKNLGSSRVFKGTQCLYTARNRRGDFQPSIWRSTAEIAQRLRGLISAQAGGGAGPLRRPRPRAHAGTHERPRASF